MYYCYILYSPKSNKLYFGYTNNLKKRYAEHNQGLSNQLNLLFPGNLFGIVDFQQ